MVRGREVKIISLPNCRTQPPKNALSSLEKKVPDHRPNAAFKTRNTLQFCGLRRWKRPPAGEKCLNTPSRPHISPGPRLSRPACGRQHHHSPAPSRPCWRPTSADRFAHPDDLPHCPEEPRAHPSISDPAPGSEALRFGKGPGKRGRGRGTAPQRPGRTAAEQHSPATDCSEWGTPRGGRAAGHSRPGGCGQD